METWLIIITTLCISFFLKLLFNLFFSKSNLKSKKLPPGPFSFLVIIGTYLWPVSDIGPTLKKLKTKYGPLINLNNGSNHSIFIASHSLAYQVLVQQGSIFSDRPKAVQTHLNINSRRINISSSPYGPLWRLLRRNLSSVILHRARVKSYSKARSWVLSVLIQQLNNACLDSANEVKLINYIHNAMFCLLVVMCFGDKIDESQVEQIKDIQSRWMPSFRSFITSSFFPKFGEIVFQNQRRKLIQLQEEQERIFIPLIEARIKAKYDGLNQYEEEEMVAYVDTLLNLELPEEKRKLKYEEIVSLCSEFLTGGIDTTATSLQWIMANLVKNPSIQEKLYQEIFEVMNRGKPKGGENNTVTEEDVQNMPYLKAVILEGLRRHPPGNLLQPHMASEEVELNGYVVPKDSTINFMVGEMGLDPEVWENPLEFKPERFLSVSGGDIEAFDITGSREIKMIPFGAGRRICPGYSLAMLHLECFVANLIWHFEWKAVEGDDVDLSEKLEVTVGMKNPLRACIHPRVNQVE